LDIKHEIEFFHELGNEDGASVRYDFVGESKVSKHLVNEYLSNSPGGESGVGWFEDDAFGKPVHNH
jgi:hypothetical protein